MRHPSKYILLLFFTSLLGCKNDPAKDNRQIVAKNEVLRRLPENISSFDVTGFNEDTLSPPEYELSAIRYKVDFQYTDSSGNIIRKTAYALFTRDGKSVTNTEIIDLNKSN